MKKSELKAIIKEAIQEARVVLKEAEATEAMFHKKPFPVKAYQTDKAMKVKTLEGEVDAKPGCWICTGHLDDQWPVDDDVFRETYEPINDEAKAAFEE